MSTTSAPLPADAATSADVAAAEISFQLEDVPSLPQRTTTTTRRKHIITNTDESSSSSVEVVESTLVSESENKGDGVVADTPVVDNTVAYLNALKEVRAFMHEGGVVAEDVDQFDIKEEHSADCMAKWHRASPAVTSVVATTATHETSTPWIGVRLRDPYKGTLLPISTCIASYLHALAHALTDEHQHTHSPLSSSSSDHSSDSSNELSPRAPSPSDLASNEHKEDEDEEERGEDEDEDESDNEDETSTSQFKADKAPQKGQRKGKGKAKGKSKKKHKTKTGFRYDEEHEDAELPRDTRGHERREKSAARKRRDSDTAAATGDRAHSHRFYKIFCSLLREAEKHGALVLTGNHAKLTRRVVTRFDSIDTEDFVSALGLPPLSSPKYDAVLCPPEPEPTVPTVPVAAAAIASPSVSPAAPSKRPEAPLTNNPKMPFSLRVQVVATKRQRQVRKTLVVPERTLAALLKEAARKLGLRVESLQTPSGERIASDDDVRALYNGSILHSV